MTSLWLKILNLGISQIPEKRPVHDWSLMQTTLQETTQGVFNV